MSAPLLIVDGDNLSHRAYHSSPKSIVGDDGKTINAIVGFFGMLNVLWQAEQPRAVFVAWDTLGVDTYRSELWPPYQTGRVFEPDIVRQLGILPTLCEAFGFGTAKQAGFEADDFVAAVTQAEVAAGGSCLIYTTDKDSYQLVNESVTVLSPKRGARELDRVGPAEVVARFGVLPEQVPDFKALAGDPSDKIPGLKGIGPKSAADLLLRHGSLEGVLASWSKLEEVDLARKFYQVAQMRPEAPVILPPTAPPDWASGVSALRLIGANGLADRLAKTHLE